MRPARYAVFKCCANRCVSPVIVVRPFALRMSARLWFEGHGCMRNAVSSFNRSRRRVRCILVRLPHLLLQLREIIWGNPAAISVPARSRPPGRRLGHALFSQEAWAARMERTTGWNLRRAGHAALRTDRRPRSVECRHGCQERLRIGMKWRGENMFDGADLDQ